MDTSEFWLVWNPRGYMPTMRHASEHSAIAEAERLAVCHKGQNFYVLRATHLRVFDSMQRVTLGEEPLPF